MEARCHTWGVKLPLWLAVIACIGCHKDGGSTAGTGTPGNEQTQEASRPQPPIAPSSGHGALVLEAPGGDVPLARYLPVDVGQMRAAGGEIAVGSEPRAPGGADEGHRFVRSATDGSRLVVAHAQGGPARVEIIDLAKPADALQLDAGKLEIAALHLSGSHVFVGSANRIHQIDLRVAKPGLVEVHERTGGIRSMKAYDLFAQHGELLVAVDDIAMPFYAELLSVGEGGGKVVESWELPTLVNGHYAHALAYFDDPKARDGILFLAASYYVRSGSGWTLYRLPVHAGKLAGHRDPGASAIGEHDPRGRIGGEGNLLAGDAHTQWHAMVSLPVGEAPRELGVCAGARGIVWVDAAFADSDATRTTDLAGPCIDLIAHGDRLFAVIGDERASKLVELDAATQAPGRSLDLPAGFTRFVR